MVAMVTYGPACKTAALLLGGEAARVFLKYPKQ